MRSRKTCPGCGSPPRGTFCAECGSRQPSDDRAGWWAAAFAFVAVAVFLLLPLLRSGAGRPGPTPGGGASSTGSAPPVATAAGRAEADALFDRVIAAAEQGDSTALQSWLTVAIEAYQSAESLDADGFFHLSTLQRAANQLAEARESAERCLEQNPDHLLGLYAAARAASDAGDHESEFELSRSILSAWNEQMAAGLPEYLAHAGMMENVRRWAEGVVEAG